MQVEVDECPKEGQFAVVWTHHNMAWSDTFKWVDGTLKIHNDKTDKFEYCGAGHPLYREDKSKRYFQAEEKAIEDMPCEKGECIVGISHGLRHVIVSERDFSKLDDDGVIFKYCPDCGRKFDHE